MGDYFWVEGLGACLKNTKVKDYIAKKKRTGYLSRRPTISILVIQPLF